MPALPALRGHLPVNFARKIIKRPLTPAAAADVGRLEAMWARVPRVRYGGPFLFGKLFGAADAMYAPVVSRFTTYAVDVTPLDPRLYGRRDGAAGLAAMA